MTAPILPAAGSRPLRVALLDDHPVVLSGLTVRLSSELSLEIVGIYERGRLLIQDFERVLPDVVVMDYELHASDWDGASLIRGLRERYPGCTILAFSAHDQPDTIALIRQAGAHAFISKRQGMTELVNAIRLVAGLPATRRTAGHASPGTPPWLPSPLLSPRELEVIRCYVQGMTVSQIAEKFHRSIKTISTQKASAFRKLGVSNDCQLSQLKLQLPV